MPPRKAKGKEKQEQPDPDANEEGSSVGKRVTKATPFFHLLHLWACEMEELNSCPEWVRIWPLPGPQDPNAESFFASCPVRVLHPDVKWADFLQNLRNHTSPTIAYNEMIMAAHPIWPGVYEWLKKHVEREYKLMKRINAILEQGLVELKQDVNTIISCYLRGRPPYACPMPKCAEFSAAQAPVLCRIMGSFAYAKGSATIPHKDTSPFWSAFLIQYMERANKARARAKMIRDKAFSEVLLQLPDGYLDSPPEMTVTKVKALIRACDEFTRAAGWFEDQPQNQQVTERLGFLEGILQDRVKFPGEATVARARGWSIGKQISFEVTETEIVEIAGIVEDWHKRLRDSPR